MTEIRERKMRDKLAECEAAAAAAYLMAGDLMEQIDAVNNTDPITRPSAAEMYLQENAIRARVLQDYTDKALALLRGLCGTMDAQRGSEA